MKDKAVSSVKFGVVAIALTFLMPYVPLPLGEFVRVFLISIPGYAVAAIAFMRAYRV